MLFQSKSDKTLKIKNIPTLFQVFGYPCLCTIF